MKKIVYLITESGMDGRAPTSILQAYWDETERDTAFANNKNRNYYSKQDKIVDVEKETTQARNKLNGLDKLLLNLPNENK